MKNFNEIFSKIKAQENKRILAVAAAEDEPVLRAAIKAKEDGLCDAILVGDEEKIEMILKDEGFTGFFKIIDEKDPKEAAMMAASLVREKKADILMKGLVDTKSLLQAVLHKERGLATGNLISHISVFEVPGFDRLLFITDAAMNIYPDLMDKKKILENGVNFMRSLGINEPKVAVICAVEVVNPNMPATMDAAALAKMNDRGQIKNCIVDGPLALDNALSEEAAKHKNIISPVAGKADLFLMPSIESANVLYKALTFTTKSKTGGLLLGASAPVVLTSRADSFESKLHAIALAVLSCQQSN